VIGFDQLGGGIVTAGPASEPSDLIVKDVRTAFRKTSGRMEFLNLSASRRASAVDTGVRPSRSVGPPCAPRYLRHTHVAMLIAENQSPRYIADRLGHESTRTVLDVYGHLYGGDDQTTMEGSRPTSLRSSDGHRTDTRPFEHRVDGNRIPESSIPARDVFGGRCRDRTCDLCRVKEPAAFK